MKGWLISLAALVLLCGGVAQATAAPIPIVYFDENGNGAFSFDGGNTKLPNPGILAIDPVQGTPALMYSLAALGGLVVSGDVQVLEPGATTSSDWMRFTNATGTLDGSQTADRMFYYSDIEQGQANTDLADRDFRVVFQNGQLAETGPEGNNAFDWLPGGIEYVGISDTPEPATLTMLGIGIAGMAGYGWRRRRTAAA